MSTSSNTNTGKVVLLGFDGMDYDLTQKQINEGILPNIAKLANEGSFSPLLSVFPPDSIPSWITTYTGLDPSEHGVLEHVNYLLGDIDEAKIDTSVFHQKTFWDRIGSETDTSVCIINPFMAYPVWPVNGIMVSGPVFIKGEIQASGEELLDGIKIPDSIGGIAVFPNKHNLKPYYDKTVSDTVEQADFGIELLKRHNSGLFFQTFVTTDRVQHHYWRYNDPSDPTYPGKTEIEGTIDDFFQRIDEIVGRFMEELDPNDSLIIMSDHGHGMRCTHCYNINEFLRRKGYLKSAVGKKKLSKKLILEKAKNMVLKFLNDHDMEEYISKIAKFVPNAKALKKGTHITNFRNSKAYGSDFAGTNPFGGICINRDQVDNYNEFSNQLIKEMDEVSNDGEKVFLWIRKREELYSGPNIERFPDILYEMTPNLGSAWSLHCDLVTINPTHKNISGGHKKNGIFFMSPSSRWTVDQDSCKITNMYSSLLHLFGLPDKLDNDSESFITEGDKP